MPANSVIQEISLEEDVYDIHGKAVLNQNASNTTLPYEYDWIGSLQEYIDQDIETEHPEWICYITDDLQGGISVYTKREVDDAVVHKTENETIAGNKTFNDVIKLRNGITPSTAYAKPNQIEDYIVQVGENTDNKKDGVEITRYQGTNGNREIRFKAGFRSSNDLSDIYSMISCGVDSANNSYITTNVTPSIDSSGFEIATTQFVQNIVPAGVILPFAGTTTPFGYFTCDGSELSRATYSKLFEAIGTTYGAGDGVNTFNIPNTSHRVLWGAGTWDVGDTYDEGLPNITGSIDLTGMGTATTPLFNPNDVTNSALYNNEAITAGRYHTDSASNSGYNRIKFDASRVNSIYGNSSTVRPRCIVVKFIIKYI